ncbi:TIR domain-containing protein [Sphingomonas segetis]|jgi:adenylate cyclase|uniref:TIR domain-containing protein n=1 Tax=Sphingomonas segetis TaxID=1104779 RepID=UPI0012D349D7|nr:TIR domain-containing protein [Sphingomonas segetis]
MADVFVSYARSDEAVAVRVADTLRREGYSVWRDDELPAHRAYAEVIEERLRSAKAVIVLWSAEAAKSQWVRAEADTARSAGTLLQATLDGTIPPLPFNQIQCADLAGWDGSADSPGWRKLKGSIGALGAATSDAADKAGSRRSQRCICVLPFQNMSGDAEQEYFSDGISEDITTDLSKISALGVVARNTAFTFKGQSVDVADVARKLGVSHVLEGSVRKAGGRVRINAQLIDGATGEHLWAERYDRDLEDIFAIQDEISKAIVQALKLKLLPEEKKALEQRGTTCAEAYNLYLLARQYWVTGNHGDPRREERVMRICGRAVQLDPYYAQAWALLAMAQSNLHYNFERDVDDGFAAAHAALSIDPTIAEAHLPMVKRLEEKQQKDAAAAEMATAIRLAPDSWEVNKDAGHFFLFRGDVHAAVLHYEKAVELMETDFHAWAMVSTCYRALGETEKLRHSASKMVSEAERSLQQDPSNGAALGIIAGGHAILGERDRAREWIDRALLIDPDNVNMRYNFACVLAGYCGEKDEALRLLAGTLALSATHLRAAETDPDLDSLRDDPRFGKIVADARKRLDRGKQACSPALTIATPTG